MLHDSRRLTVVGVAHHAEDAIETARDLRPDVVLVDVALTDMLPALVDAVAPGRVLAFGVARDELQGVIASAEAGVCGYVDSDASLGDLEHVLAGAVHDDEPVCPAWVTSALLRRVGTLARDRVATNGVRPTRLANLGVCAADAAQTPRFPVRTAPPSPLRAGARLVRQLPPASLQEGGSSMNDGRPCGRACARGRPSMRSLLVQDAPAVSTACETLWSLPPGGTLEGAVGHAGAPSRWGLGEL